MRQPLILNKKCLAVLTSYQNSLKPHADNRILETDSRSSFVETLQLHLPPSFSLIDLEFSHNKAEDGGLQKAKEDCLELSLRLTS